MFSSSIKSKWIHLYLILLTTVFSYCHVRLLPPPKLYGNKIPDRDVNTSYSKTRRQIVIAHNYYRSIVDPPASNMLNMFWHHGAARTAQSWSEACRDLTHSGRWERWVKNYGFCGQNIFIASHKVSWLFAIKSWNSEKQLFHYGRKDNNINEVGHYTQMVWYNTHVVGCGYHYCGPDRVRKPYHNYVCNYCPIGNYPDKVGTPYESGQPCSKCPGRCKRNKLCTNACYYGDSWSNCAELNITSPDWLCVDPKQQRYSMCLATCRCTSDRIF